MQPRVSGALAALSGYGAKLQQSEKPSTTTTTAPPSLADLARKAGKGIEQGEGPTTVTRTQEQGNTGPAPPRRHPKDPSLYWDAKARAWKKTSTLSMSGR